MSVSFASVGESDGFSMCPCTLFGGRATRAETRLFLLELKSCMSLISLN